jgi:hypothetical protein
MRTLHDHEMIADHAPIFACEYNVHIYTARFKDSGVAEPPRTYTLDISHEAVAAVVVSSCRRRRHSSYSAVSASESSVGGTVLLVRRFQLSALL